MLFYYFIFFFTLVLIVFTIRFLLLKGNNIPVELFSKALRNENSGDFEAAIINYQTALQEVAKARFPSSRLKNKILGKLKVLKTVIDYKSSFHCLKF
jgi:hypothetical protein